MFLLCSGAVVLVQHRLHSRLIGYSLILAAGLLKFYPIVALALVARERLRRCIPIAIIFIAIISLLIHVYYDELIKLAPNIDTGSPFYVMFGAVNLPYGLIEILGNNSQFRPIHPIVLFSIFAILTLGYAVYVAHRADTGRGMATLPKGHVTFLVLGALLIIGCFFAGQSYPYRGIHFLFVLPALLTLSRPSAGQGRGLIFSVSSIVVVFLMWGEWFRRAADHIATRTMESPELPNMLFWLGRELAWWWLVGFLAGLVISAMSMSSALLDLRVLFESLGQRLLRKSA